MNSAYSASPSAPCSPARSGLMKSVPRPSTVVGRPIRRAQAGSAERPVARLAYSRCAVSRFWMRDGGLVQRGARPARPLPSPASNGSPKTTSTRLRSGGSAGINRPRARCCPAPPPARSGRPTRTREVGEPGAQRAKSPSPRVPSGKIPSTPPRASTPSASVIAARSAVVTVHLQLPDAAQERVERADERLLLDQEVHRPGRGAHEHRAVDVVRVVHGQDDRPGRRAPARRRARGASTARTSGRCRCGGRPPAPRGAGRLAVRGRHRAARFSSIEGDDALDDLVEGELGGVHLDRVVGLGQRGGLAAGVGRVPLDQGLPGGGDGLRRP